MSLLMWGLNEDGQCGEPNSESITLPHHIDLRETVACVSLGSRHSILCCHEGRVYSWGWGAKGQLGHGDLESVDTPTAIEALSNYVITGVSAGGYHSTVVNDSGEVFAFGGGSYGQLGQGDANREDSSLPLKVNFSPYYKEVFITAVESGGAHSVALNRDGQLFSWGRSIDGQLGLGILNEIEGNGGASPTPLQINIKQVVAVSCGAFHTAAVTKGGALYTWGKEDYGMLGHGPCADVHEPRRVESLTGIEIKQVSCGGWHTIAVDSRGSVYSFGRGEYGRLGLGDDTSTRVPKKIEIPDKKKVTQACAGGTHTLFLCEDGSVLACGRGLYGRLGVGHSKTVLTPAYVLSESGEIGSHLSGAVSIAVGGTHCCCLHDP